jgi:hypothetical protein
MIVRILGSATLLIAAPILGVAWADSIDEDQFDPKQIFFGDPKDFDAPAAVNIGKVIEATPEYQEIKTEKIKRGTGKYWILLSKATDCAVAAIAEVAKELNYDLVAENSYLIGLKPKVTAEDVTKSVVEKIE